MPKQKTHRGAAKRFSLSKDGTRIKHARAWKGHKLNNPQKNSKRKRRLRKNTFLDVAETKKIKMLIPYK